MQGTFGYELDLSKLTDDEKDIVKEQVRIFKQHYRLFQFGDYYRLTSPAQNHDFMAWEYADKHGEEACLSVVFTDLHGNPVPQLVTWKGLLPDERYTVSLDGEEIGSYTGTALMQGGILLPIPKENYDSCQFYACIVK